MMPYTDAVQLIANLILYMMWGALLIATLDARYRRWITWAAWIAAFFPWMAPSFAFPVGTIPRSLVSPVVYFTVIFFLFKGKPIKILFPACVNMMIMALCELITVMIFPSALIAPDFILGSSVGKQILMFSIYLLFNAFMLWVSTLFLNRYRNRLSSQELMLYILFPVSQFILLISWFSNLFRGISVWSTAFEALGALACVAADTALYYAVRGMAERADLRAQNAMLEKQIDAQKEHYAALTEQYENVRRMRHDIDNHLHTMRILLENGRTDEAAAYLAELNPGAGYVSALGRCRNPVADAFLYTRIRDLRAQGAEVDADVELPYEMSISNADLVSAFGNLLDNAAEAIRGAEKKHITVCAFIKNGYLVIKTENPSPAAADDRKRRIPELERGVGFHILSALAEKYDGDFSAAADGGMFRASLSLREMNDCA